MGTSQNRTTLADSTTYRISRMYTLSAEDANARPHTNTISSAQTSGSHSQYLFTWIPKASVIATNSPIWMNRCKQLDRTAAIGTISRGIASRLMRPALSRTDPVPTSHAALKKLNGTMPHIKKTAKCGILFWNIKVNTNVNINSMMSGFATDQRTPSDMFR